MPISKNTKALLEELKNSGFDPAIITSVENEFNSKPATEQTFDRRILANESFQQFRTNKETEINQLKSRVNELSALHDQRSSGALLDNPDLLKRANERIQALETLLIDEEGYNPEQVKSLSFTEKQEIEKVLANQQNNDKGKEKV